MSYFTPSGSAGSTGTVVISGSTTGVVDNLNIPLANTEVSYTFPTNTTGFLMKLRGYTASTKFSYTAAASGTTYFTIPPGCFHSSDGLSLTSTLTIYLQTTAASQVLEIEYWTS